MLLKRDSRAVAESSRVSPKNRWQCLYYRTLSLQNRRNVFYKKSSLGFFLCCPPTPSHSTYETLTNQKLILQFTVIYIVTVVFKAPLAKWKLHICRSVLSSIQTECEPALRHWTPEGLWSNLNLVPQATPVSCSKPPHYKLHTVQWIQCVTTRTNGTLCSFYLSTCLVCNTWLMYLCVNVSFVFSHFF